MSIPDSAMTLPAPSPMRHHLLPREPRPDPLAVERVGADDERAEPFFDGDIRLDIP